MAGGEDSILGGAVSILLVEGLDLAAVTTAMGKAAMTMAMVRVMVITAMGVVKVTMAMLLAVVTTAWLAVAMVVAGADTTTVESLSREVAIAKGPAVAMPVLEGAVRIKVMAIPVLVGIEILFRDNLVALRVKISTVRGVALMVFFRGEVTIMQTITAKEEISNVGTLAVLVLL
jgi:hypothetical protein